MSAISPAQYAVTMVDISYNSLPDSDFTWQKNGCMHEVQNRALSCEKPVNFLTGSIGMVISASCPLVGAGFRRDVIHLAV